MPNESESNISRALRAVVADDNPSTRRGLYDALKNQRLVLPVFKVPNNLERDKAGRLLGNMPVDFLSFRDRSGRKFMAVFTNPDALNKWKADAPTWIAVDAPSLVVWRWNPANHRYKLIPEIPTLWN